MKLPGGEVEINEIVIWTAAQDIYGESQRMHHDES